MKSLGFYMSNNFFAGFWGNIKTLLEKNWPNEVTEKDLENTYSFLSAIRRLADIDEKFALHIKDFRVKVDWIMGGFHKKKQRFVCRDCKGKWTTKIKRGAICPYCGSKRKLAISGKWDVKNDPEILSSMWWLWF